MPHKLRKTRKNRGSRTQGYGQIGQHRRSGTQGRKKSSFDKGGWTYVVKYEPNYFGDKGFTSIKSRRQKTNVINVGELDELIRRLTFEQKLEKEDDKIRLDLEKLGYSKLLARGNTKTSVIIKSPSCSEDAIRKIEDAGGQVLGQSE